MSTAVQTEAENVASDAAAGGPRVDVIGIGVQKAATSWIYRCLVEHPEVRAATSMRPSRKELNFFNHDYERGYAWYHRRFAFGPWKTLEFSTLYFHDRDVPIRIQRYSPDAKLMVSLRNPIDRAFSQHKHEVRKRELVGGLRDFWAALEQNPSYVEQGFYATHLERWREQFDPAQIHVTLYDDIRARPAKVIADAFRFIGVDPGYRPSALARWINVGLVPRSATLDRYMRTSSRVVRKLLGESAVLAVRATGLPALIRDRNRVDLAAARVPPLMPADRARLAELFAEENERLGELLGRDFSHWR